MNNNQFKAFLREEVETLCKNKNIKPIYIDVSSNERIYYLYDEKFNVKGTLSIWTGNDSCSIRISTNKENIVTLSNCDTSYKDTYMHLDKLLARLNNAINMLDIKGIEVKKC